MVSRMVLVAAAAALVCLATQVEAAPRDAKFFLFDFEKKDKETGNGVGCGPASAVPGDAGCVATNAYCKYFGGTRWECVAKKANGKKCDRPAMCESGKCPSICYIFDTDKCIQKCEA
ncbi:hypothetical protein FJT64_005699 [Amphibalanus amphitrite]|uniref:WAP domain-containing protein n=1 Tax=Amphibalanus amphitrite TaxID=1232801 RepID=A0A6A4VT50_AMPAM|nr:hypothetical protein FJT64_005699 [Amphibalanus amphitrite]